MTYAVYLPLILPALLGLAARQSAKQSVKQSAKQSAKQGANQAADQAADRLPPRAGAIGLTIAASLAAAASMWALTLLVLTLFDDLPSMVVKADGLPEPVPDWLALTALAALLLATSAFGNDLHQRHSLVRLLRADQPAADDVVMADDDEPLAVALPGRPGQILLTTGMARLLGPRERAAVLAHERAHLKHRHHVLMAAAGGAAAINPLLRPVRDTVAYLIERWADEDAAATLGDRDLVARAVAKAALATADRKAALGVHGGVVVRRVRALHQPIPAASRKPLVVISVVVGAGLVAAAVATSDFVVLLHTWLVA